MDFKRISLGFLGFLGLQGWDFLKTGDWKDALWFLFFIYFIYFLPEKKKE